MQTDSYKRKISSKEANEGFLFIKKNKLSFFPPLNCEFILINNNSPQEVMVESYPCTCRGPDKPHEHYFIRWKGLSTSDAIVINKKGENYILKINPK